MGFICALDATVLGVAIPVRFWASISFLLAVVIVQPLYASVSNIMGYIMPLYASYFFFIVGSIIFGLSQSMTVLIVGRTLQGLGAGGLDVLNEVILADITTLKERPMYLRCFSIPMLKAPWIEWINLPLPAIGLVLAIIFMKLKAIDQPLRASAMFPWSSYEMLGSLLLGAIPLVAFVYYENKPTEPVLPYRMFNDRTASLKLLASFLHGLANYSVTLYVPLFFQAVYLKEPLPTVVLTLLVCFLAITTAVAAAVAAETMREYRLVIVVGWIFMTVGAGVLTLLKRSSTLAEIESFQVILGIGIGTFCVPVDDMSFAAGILCSFRLFGGLIGLTVSSTIFNSVFADIIAGLQPLPEAIGFVPLLRHVEASAELLGGVIDAYRRSIFGLLWMVAGTAVVEFLISWFIKDEPLD
ncbi:MFS general substrate transporter [Lojkania enalia]|uniref:MFS general substrate transporter n=1 Tax=Lojkania enalia TaxID=147567 RepID=A0A9P4N6P2_9PLEO|nr:MFS general substrate transporter [Didymosphaeria enalia]